MTDLKHAADMKGSYTNHLQSADSPEVDLLLEQVAELARVRHSEFDDEDETRRKLNAHGLSDAEIARQMATLESNTSNSTAVLTSYSLLHSLQHLDAIIDRSPRRGYSAEALVTLFQCAEICIYNIGVHSRKMKANLEGGRLSLAVSDARWRAGFHEVLYRLSSLVVEVSADSAPGSFLSIRDSRIYRGYERENAALQDFLRTTWVERDADIFAKDLDDPQRYVFFSEFVNSSDERVWLSRLNRVRLPEVTREPGDDDDATFYERVVCTDEITAMLEALETKAETDLLSFRAVHQISEVIGCHINRQLCDVVVKLLSPQSASLDKELRVLVVSNRMLSVVDDVIKLMMRTLTPRAYKDIRPNLGMVRGTSSVVLRKTLFNITYPLLVRAFKLRISEFSSETADDDEAVYAKAVALLECGDTDERCAEMMQQLILFYQHVRTWRDNHQQLPKTHLGVSPFQGQPTVSLSGSGSAVDIAHGLRRTHQSDPIIPLYKAVLGTAPPDVHEMLTPDGFEEHMAHATARAVLDVYADVQTRFYERSQKKKPQSE